MNKLCSVSGLILVAVFLLGSCTTRTSQNEDLASYDPGIPDDYSNIMHPRNYEQWGPYNVHDPSIIKSGDYYYLYSTDAMYLRRGMRGALDSIDAGNIPIRRSRDLVHWEFLGWALDSVPQEAITHIEEASGGRRPRNIWAPYILKAGDEFRLYYSVSIFGANTSYIGLAKSESPEGPWTLAGCAVKTDTLSPMNSIDPTVVIDPDNGRHWMIYGSYFSGLYGLELNPETGLAMTEGDQGFPVARRAEGKTRIIEAPEVIYNPDLKKYFLFVSYEPLFTHYNVRVGRSDTPEGPYLDYNGNDLAQPENNLPVLTYAYRFENHPGWAGVGHCGVIRDGDNYFMVHQGRLAPDNLMMVLHVRKILWTEEGWPVVSPERYAGIPEIKITRENLIGTWETIRLSEIYDSVVLWQGQIPGGGWKYSTGMFNNSEIMEFLGGGEIRDEPDLLWTYRSNQVILENISGGDPVSLMVINAWDWENSCPTIAFTGLSPDGFGFWGKKVVRE